MSHLLEKKQAGNFLEDINQTSKTNSKLLLFVPLIPFIVKMKRTTNILIILHRENVYKEHNKNWNVNTCMVYYFRYWNSWLSRSLRDAISETMPHHHPHFIVILRKNNNNIQWNFSRKYLTTLQSPFHFTFVVFILLSFFYFHLMSTYR